MPRHRFAPTGTGSHLPFYPLSPFTTSPCGTQRNQILSAKISITRVTTYIELGGFRSGFRSIKIPHTLTYMILPPRFSEQFQLIVLHSWSGVPVLGIPCYTFQVMPGCLRRKWGFYSDGSQVHSLCGLRLWPFPAHGMFTVSNPGASHALPFVELLGICLMNWRECVDS